MNSYEPGSRLAWDWYSGTIPPNASIDPTAYIETTFSFRRLRSQRAEAVRIGRGAATYLGTMFDVDAGGRVSIGDFAFVHGVWFICDVEIDIGAYSMLSWNVVLMDTYRASFDALQRRRELRSVPHSPDRQLRAESQPARPVRIGANVWIGFEACVMPGVTVGDGAIVGAKSVVFDDVAPYTVAAGNPARHVRDLPTPAHLQGGHR